MIGGRGIYIADYIAGIIYGGLHCTEAVTSRTHGHLMTVRHNVHPRKQASDAVGCLSGNIGILLTLFPGLRTHTTTTSVLASRSARQGSGDRDLLSLQLTISSPITPSHSTSQHTCPVSSLIVTIPALFCHATLRTPRSIRISSRLGRPVPNADSHVPKYFTTSI